MWFLGVALIVVGIVLAYWVTIGRLLNMRKALLKILNRDKDPLEALNIEAYVDYHIHIQVAIVLLVAFAMVVIGMIILTTI